MPQGRCFYVQAAGQCSRQPVLLGAVSVDPAILLQIWCAKNMAKNAF
eukprot:COSAG05_NODE_5456_length_1168_cov_6.617206_1_plen_46_part_10